MAYTLEEGTRRQHTFTPQVVLMLFILGTGSISYGYTAAIIGTTLGKYYSDGTQVSSTSVLTWQGRPTIVHHIL